MLFVVSLNGYGQITSFDNYTGIWNDTDTWDGGVVPDATDLDEDVTIYGYVTREGNLSMKNGSSNTMTIADTLVVNGNLTIGNMSKLVIEWIADCSW